MLQSSVPSALAAKTLSRLRSSIQVKGPLPGLASAVRLIEMAGADDAAKDTDIVNAVLADPGLVHKVLRLANSAMYASFGGQIDTVSRALVILGTETVAHLAFSQTLLDNLKPATTTTPETVETMETAILASHVARQFAKEQRPKDIETAAICAMMHSMGRILLEFYLPYESSLLKKHREQTGLGENEVAAYLLGLSLDTLGLEAAQEWGMPSSIRAGLRPILPMSAAEPLNAEDKLATMATLAHKCAQTVSQGSDRYVARQLIELTSGYAAMLGKSPEELLIAVCEAGEQAHDQRGTVAPELAAQVEQARARLTASKLRTECADICDRLQRSAANEALTLTTTSLFRTLQLSRAYLFIRRGKGYAARIGLGPNARESLDALSFAEGSAADMLSRAIMANEVIFIGGAHSILPQSGGTEAWHSGANALQNVIFVPVRVADRPVGFIYGEWVQGDSVYHVQREDFAAIEDIRLALAGTLLRTIQEAAAQAALKRQQPQK